MWATRSRRAKSGKESLAMVGLQQNTMTKAFPIELSGGEQQGWRIARAIRGNASAILADEPTGALDTQNGQAIMTLLAQIAKTNLAGCWSSPTIRYPAVRQFASCTSKMADRSDEPDR